MSDGRTKAVDRFIANRGEESKGSQKLIADIQEREANAEPAQDILSSVNKALSTLKLNEQDKLVLEGIKKRLQAEVDDQFTKSKRSVSGS